MTDLQVQAWAEWLVMDMNRPGKSERYAAQTACEVRRSWVKTPSSVNPDDFLMEFVPRPAADGSQLDDDSDDEATLEAEKKVAMAAFGGRSKYTPPPPREPDPSDEDQWSVSADDPWEQKGYQRMESDG